MCYMCVATSNALLATSSAVPVFKEQRGDQGPEAPVTRA